MFNIIRISAGIIMMFVFMQSASAQTAVSSGIDTYTQTMLYVVLLLIASIFFVLIFHGDMEDKPSDKTVFPTGQAIRFSSVLQPALENKLANLFRIAFISLIAAILLYLLILILVLKNVI